MKNVKVGLCQMKVGPNKQDNLNKARYIIKQAANKGAEIVMLPEMFNCPYGHKYFQSFAEILPGGDTEQILSETARQEGIYLIGGSFPELSSEGQLFNTSLTFGPKGNLIGKYRKVHLFDMHVKDGIHFKESATLTAGNQITLIDTPWGKIGVMICYDIRFTEQTRIMAMKGAQMIFIPAAFNMTTGPAHWELLFRSRALDNQVFMFGCSPARDNSSPYIAYGHSLVTNPWGQVVAQLDEEEGILIVNVNLTEVDEVRQSIPIWEHQKKEIYK